MERLTWEDKDGGYYTQEVERVEHDGNEVFTGPAIDSLAAYEDLGTVEELREMKEAGEMPCKIGDVLWYWYQVGENGQPQVGSFIATGVLLQKDGWYVMGGYSYDFDKIGTSVFLTAEQAAQAAMEGNGNDQT